MRTAWLIKVGIMLRANQFWFYDLGSKIHPLTEIPDNTKVSEQFWRLWGSRKLLQETYASFPLRVSKNAAHNLYAAITAALPEDFQEALATNTEGSEVTFIQAYNIRESAKSFETVLAAELQVMDTYLVSQKGTYSTPDLIDRGDLMIPDSLRSDIPEQCQVDLKAASRCLAFNVPTATAFHALRATESVIRVYYEEVTGSKPKPKMRNWGTYVKNLNKAGANPRITEFIDHLRELYRNPIFHPEDNLTSEESIVFLGTCVSLICNLVIETQRLRNDSSHQILKQCAQITPANPAILLPPQ